jgi:hypothetical protein
MSLELSEGKDANMFRSITVPYIKLIRPKGEGEVRK